MSQIEPRIVERFPVYRERILRKCFQDAAVAELCRDYDCLIETIEAANPRQGAASQAGDVRQDLLELEMPEPDLTLYEPLSAPQEETP